MRHLSLDPLVEQVGYGRFQRRLLWVCGLGWAADAMEVMLVSFALPAMAAEWSLSAAQKGLLATALFVGMLAGALIWGRLSDLIGRKLGFMATIGIDSLFGLLSAFSPNFAVFLVLRMLTGFGVGGTLPVDYAVFAEFLPAKDRGKRLVLLESFWAFGTLAAAGLAWLVVPRLGWRALFVVSAIPGVLLFAVRSYVPESPRYLAVSGQQDEAIQVLRNVARINGKELDESAVALAEQLAQEPQKSSVKDLFSRDLRRTTLLLWSIWFFISIGYYGIFTWIPSWLRAKGFALPAVYPYSFFMALAQLPGYFSAAYLVEKIGRRLPLGLYLAGSGLGALAFSLAVSPAGIVGAAIILSFFALGAWGALYAYTPEAYPTIIRTTGIGSASGMTRIAGVIAPFVGALLSGQNLVTALLVFGVAYGLGALSAFLLPHETWGSALEDE
ncbi:MFS transporter [Gracilinema caldarium]|uniref:Major facilitator superfamily MFS_1 n=1 Tax=Gracilinema caldarium (strain ATCC 51460 / DSM 7334 / H1) TaxID=744872 RepID=F8EZR5_GRAC1|nr:MFS transporter [Gracilinema caldarium]AEJ20789.1 major facilitator superfamily MFS_1 [Gracilinema caldarium DSM 7334]